MENNREIGEPRDFSDLENTIRALSLGISGFLSTDNRIWSDRDESGSFLATVDRLLEAIRNWHRISSQNPTINPYLNRANELLEMVMFRLEDEFRYVIERNDTYGNFADASGKNGAAADPDTNIPVAYPISDYDVLIDVFPSHTISELQDIAQRMIIAKFEKECFNVYRQNRRNFLEVSLSRLGIQKLSDVEIQQIQQEEIENEITRWISAFKVAIRILFPTERHLCDQIFFRLPYYADQVFMQVCLPSATQLLNIADSVAASSREPERLFKVLNIFETMHELMPAIEEIFSDKLCYFLYSEALAVLERLRQTVRGMFLEFENLIARDPPRSCNSNCNVHRITSYVMNYLCLAFSDYSRTLDNILAESTSSSSVSLKDGGSPLASQILWILKLLENNLATKSTFYEEQAQASIFLMNNGCYILQKARDSNLEFLLGEEWLKRQKSKINQYQARYMRNSWAMILSAMNAESGFFTTANMAKKKIKIVTALFDEVINTQSTWIVPDEKAKSKLWSAIAAETVPAYRNFLGRALNVLEKGEHAKYSVDAFKDRIKELFSNSGSIGNRR